MPSLNLKNEDRNFKTYKLIMNELKNESKVLSTARKNKPLTYISLFSGAGVGCYGFKMNGFECIATNELLTKRLNIQIAKPTPAIASKGQ